MEETLIYYTLLQDPSTRCKLDLTQPESLKIFLEGKLEKGEIDSLEFSAYSWLPKQEYDAAVWLDHSLSAIMKSLQTENCRLRSLKFDWIPPYFPIGRYIEPMLQRNVSLTCLSINRHVLGVDELVSIGRGLAQNRNIREMDLRLCNISANGIKRILENSTGNTSLMLVDFSENHIVNEELNKFGVCNGFVLKKAIKDECIKFYLSRAPEQPKPKSASLRVSQSHSRKPKLTKSEKSPKTYTPKYQSREVRLKVSKSSNKERQNKKHKHK